MQDNNWYIWNHDTTYANTMHKRATGDLPEMESAKALCNVLKPYYQRGLTIADIGCGGGHYLHSLRRRLDPEINYTGVDATESYVRIAQEAFPEVPVYLGDIYALPFTNESFDIVTCCNLISFLPPPPVTALKELLRIARKYVVLRVTIGERNYIIKELRGLQDVQGLRECDLVKRESDLELFSYHNMYTESYYREILQELSPGARPEFIKDDSYQSFDNRNLTDATGTRVIGGQQVAGNLLLDWQFIVISKPSSH
jgi:ubiquinone/menaquinone biosynthesis C-methylase UbiE